MLHLPLLEAYDVRDLSYQDMYFWVLCSYLLLLCSGEKMFKVITTTTLL